MGWLLSIVSIVCYLSGAYKLWQGLHGTPSRLPMPIIGWTSVGLFSQLAALPALLWQDNGIDLGLPVALTISGSLVVAIYLLLCIARKLDNLGLLVLPLAALFSLAPLLLPLHHILPIGDAYTLELHIMVSMMAYSLLTLTALQAILMGVQERQLRQHRIHGLLHHLPPLQAMEDLLFQVLSLGFILHSISLLSGLLFIDDLFAQHLVHKTVLSILAWLVFATLLWGRWRFGWRGRQALRWIYIGLGILLLAFVGTKVVLEGILS